jgi:DSF synthase
LWPDPARSPVLFLAYRGVGPVYALGGDLDFYLECIANNDRGGLEDYARLAIEIMNLNASGLGQRVITMATVHAKALGGSIDPPRSCHVMIAETKARFGYPEVAFNHFPIAAVPILSRRIGEREAQRILMSGEEFSAQQFFERGVLDEVVADGAGEMTLRDYASRFQSSHAARLALYSAFYRHAGDLEQELAISAADWVDHVLRLRPLDIARLQRIVQIQDKMLSRLFRPRDAAAADVARVDQSAEPR